MSKTLSYDDVRFLENDTPEPEEIEAYEDEELLGSTSTPLVFDEEIIEVLNRQNPVFGAVPMWFRATDGTEVYFFRPGPDEIRLEVVCEDD